MKKTLLLLAALVATSLSAQAGIFVGTTTSNALVTFDSTNPSVFLSTTPITGLFASDGITADPSAVLVNLALNPTNNLYYGIDTNANFYEVSLDGSTDLIDSTFAPTGFAAGFAYDPFNDAFLFASDTAENILIDINGVRTVNPALEYGVGDPNVASTPSIFATGIDPITGESYFADATLGIISISVDPNFSELFTLGNIGTAVVAFGGLTVDFDGDVFAAFSEDSVDSKLFTIDKITGAATFVGNFSQGIHSIAPTPVPEPSTVFVCIGLGALLVWRLSRRHFHRNTETSNLI